MGDQQNLFAAFGQISKEEWVAKITADLKGRLYSELEWPISDQLKMPPVFHPDDVAGQPRKLSIPALDNDWQIGEAIQVVDVKTANAQALEALAKGSNALRFELNAPCDESALRLLLKDIQLRYISTHFQLSNPNTALQPLIKAFAILTSEQEGDPKLLKGSWSFDSKGIDYPQLAEWLNTSQQYFPLFKALTITIDEPAEQLQALSQAIQQANTYIYELSQHGLSPQSVAQQLQFSLAIGKLYFVELACLRALHLLWANLLEAYGCTAQAASIEAHTASQAYSSDIHSNMISATTQAMSAILGGIDRLFVLPANATIEAPTVFTRRIARNLQHLLKMESYLDRVVDPAAGSYYIEELTCRIAEKCWKDLT